MEKLELYRINATMPWAEIETINDGIRLVHYDGAQEDAPNSVLVLNKKDAKALTKAINILIENYV